MRNDYPYYGADSGGPEDALGVPEWVNEAYIPEGDEELLEDILAAAAQEIQRLEREKESIQQKNYALSWGQIILAAAFLGLFLAMVDSTAPVNAVITGFCAILAMAGGLWGEK